ncbi:MAG: valine--tRNA ligase [Phycisphaerales bacterium]|nr:valine--tRNA ligase [Phycisphaerales bacterium]
MRAKWEASGAFAADPKRVLSGEKPPFCMFIPPPNVTGALHLGHALNNTLQDILTRSHRMMGFEALWMPGTDHAGIATQAVVEKRLRQDGTLKGPLKDPERNGGWTREKFVNRIGEWKDEYEARITEQLKAMGASCDFSRQRFTMDSVCAAAVREAFFRLFRDGLIYRGKRLVNWDPVLQTAVADDECYDEEINGSFYYLRYPLVAVNGQMAKLPNGQIDKAEKLESAASGGHLKDGAARPVTWGELARRGYPGAEAHDAASQAWITVATTRPETYLGDTGVAINPHDTRAKALRGLSVELPLVGRVVPIVEDEYVVLPRKMAEELGRDEDAKDAKSEFASGFLKVTPAHDQNDYELGQRHKLAMINVMAPDASISDKHGWADIGDAHIFVGKKREEARKLVVKYFDDHFVPGTSEKLLEQVKPYRHSVKHSDRSKAIVEPYLSDQWYVKVTDATLAGAANEAIGVGAGSGKVAEWQSGRVGEGGENSKAAQQQSSKSDGESAGFGDSTRLQFFPERYAKTYQQWHEGIRDWCISRQLWWGHRIPVWSAGLVGGGDLPQVMERIESLEASGRIAFTQTPVNPSSIQASQLQTAPTLESAATMSEYEQAIAATPKWRFACVRSATDTEAIAFLEAAGFIQDPDVLDTWFSSALWPLSTLGWPDPAAAEKMLPGSQFQGLLEAYNPSSVLSTAREIITLWVSRMVMMNRYLMPEGWGQGQSSKLKAQSSNRGSADASAGSPLSTQHSSLSTQHSSLSTSAQGRGPVPFREVFIHAVVQDGDGKKMAKSVGNGVDPLDIISSHGADAMRFTLCQMTTQTQDVRMPVQKDSKTGKNTSPKFDLGRNFASKLWNAVRFAILMLEKSEAPAREVRFAELSLVDQWMVSRLNAGIASCNESIRAYEFSAYAEACYDLLWRDFCDFYLEAIKPTVAQSESQRAVLRVSIETILRLMHPIMPFVTEAAYEQVSKLPAASVEGVSLLGARPASAPGAHGSRGVAALLCVKDWPRGTMNALLGPGVDIPLVQATITRVRELATMVNQARATGNVPPRARLVLHASEKVVVLAGQGPRVVETLCGLTEIVGTPPSKDDRTLMLRFEGEELRLSGVPEPVVSENASPGAAAADASAAREALVKQRDEVKKKIANIEGRLSNPGYIAKAPPKLVEESQSQLKQLYLELQAIEAALGGA